MAVRGFVDVGHGSDEHEGQQDYKAGETPATIGFGGDVAVDMVSHGGQSKHGCVFVGSWAGQNRSQARNAVSGGERVSPDSVKTTEAHNLSWRFGCLKC